MRVLDGFEATRHISREMPNTKVIILTELGTRDNVADAFLAGARGCLPMATSRADLVSAIRMVHQGEAYLHPSLTKCLVEDYLILKRAKAHGDPYESLTDREKHVLRLIGDGLTIREMARQLGTAEKTVMGHKDKIMKKLGVHGRISLVKYAVRRGITNLEQ
jgi:two-component system response regulator NreC